MKLELIDQFPNQLIVEISDIDLGLKLEDVATFVDSNHYENQFHSGRRLYAHNDSFNTFWISTEIKELLYKKIIPLMSASSKFYPVDDLELVSQLAKDEINWGQSKHEDLKNIIMSGVIHLTDCNTPTTFYDDNDNVIYTAPTHANCGAVWYNITGSIHNVPVIQGIERNHIIFFLRIKDANL